MAAKTNRSTIIIYCHTSIKKGAIFFTSEIIFFISTFII